MKAELVLIPLIYRGHFPAALEFAKLLVSRSHELSITVLLLKLPNDPKLDAYNESLVASFTSDRIKFVDVNSDSDSDPDSAENNPLYSCVKRIERYRSGVRSAVVTTDGLARTGLSGFVLDMACMPMADVASELGIPTYSFWASSASFLGLSLHLQITGQTVDSETDEHKFPGFSKPVPRSVLPAVLFGSGASLIFDWAKRIRESRGMIVNTSVQIEPQALKALISPSPPVYAVGPILHFPESRDPGEDNIMAWLNLQPPESVLFLCFGSLGVSFDADQLKEIAAALESSGVRFIWSDTQFKSSEPILPNGFLERTAERGRVTGWAPQCAVLGHVAVGGFVSHCGWNSVLESLWHGVPVAAWPLYAEQQLNAFAMVEEMELAAELKRGCDVGEIISAKTIEAAIRVVMEGETSELRKRVKEMAVKCRTALAHGGSSFSSLDRFLSDFFDNLNIK